MTVMFYRSLFALLSFGHCIVCPSVYADYPFGVMFYRSVFVLLSFGHCIVCPSVYADYPFGVMTKR
jgi:hypothetical protein